MPKVRDWNELMRHQLCSFGHGSYVYGCETVNSDIDSVVIVDDSVDLSDCQNGIYQTECMYDMIIYDTQFINDSTFRKMIDEHHIIVIESMWMSKDEYCEYDYFMENYFPLFKLDKWKLRQTISGMLVDYPTMNDRSVMNLKSSDRSKQEVDKEQGLTLFKFQ